uniref:(California timema) hypothetical protein n=1 Tax=Timema californicum TaxID=61474 RepID=A0A7R9J173_TIMCA|nr:unnamed protein product [Timema californicum]
MRTREDRCAPRMVPWKPKMCLLVELSKSPFTRSGFNPPQSQGAVRLEVLDETRNRCRASNRVSFQWACSMGQDSSGIKIVNSNRGVKSGHLVGITSGYGFPVLNIRPNQAAYAHKTEAYSDDVDNLVANFEQSITKSYYRNSVGALLVYDICNRASFEHIPLWMMEAKRHIEPHRPVFALVGCKLDLANSSNIREVSLEEARAFAEQNGLHHVETSAKSGVNVEDAFRLVTQEVYGRIQTGEYKVEDGWDGIKTGFQRPGGLDFNLIEAEPAKSTCC